MISTLAPKALMVTSGPGPASQFCPFQAVIAAIAHTARASKVGLEGILANTAVIIDEVSERSTFIPLRDYNHAIRSPTRAQIDASLPFEGAVVGNTLL